MQTVEQWIEQDPRAYSSPQLAQKLTQERQFQLSPRRLRHYTSKKGFRWKRTRHSHRGKQDLEQKRLKQADLDTRSIGGR
ncbi:hypothetical protein [Scytonema sp. HK-05]|uniref:hypothetical protein n=1 Tax=Scytonema sp. HK-05 TaxID=1137095 RepID=UPI00093684CE|nr:hypothetical protein NIES2130_33980 [Scytonema sp. HK-05]